jgi:hypothetical protein
MQLVPLQRGDVNDVIAQLQNNLTDIKAELRAACT